MPETSEEKNQMGYGFPDTRDFRTLRKYFNLTQQELADEAGVNRQTVVHAESDDHGAPQESTRHKFAQAMDVPEWVVSRCFLEDDDGD